MTSELAILTKLSNMILEVKEALKAHRKATVYESRLLGLLSDLHSMWSVTKREVESQGLQELCSEPDNSFQAIQRIAAGTRPKKSRLTVEVRKAEAAIRDLRIKVETQAVPQDYVRLKVRVDALQNDILQGILQEAFRCWRIGSRRACIVLSWCAVEAKIFDLYRSRWNMQQIKNLVPQANRKEIQVVDDLTTISDAYLLRGLRNARLLTPTEFKILDGVCATYRNIAAHASQKKLITDAEVSSVVENMIEFLEKPV